MRKFCALVATNLVVLVHAGVGPTDVTLLQSGLQRIASNRRRSPALIVKLGGHWPLVTMDSRSGVFVSMPGF